MWKIKSIDLSIKKYFDYTLIFSPNNKFHYNFEVNFSVYNIFNSSLQKIVKNL